MYGVLVSDNSDHVTVGSHNLSDCQEGGGKPSVTTQLIGAKELVPLGEYLVDFNMLDLCGIQVT